MIIAILLTLTLGLGIKNSYSEIIAHGIFLIMLGLSLFHISKILFSSSRSLRDQTKEIANSTAIKADYYLILLSQKTVFRKKILTIALLELISVIIYHDWLSFKIFISGDYHWIPAQTLAYLRPLSAWRAFLTTGEPNWVLWSGYSTSFFGWWGEKGLDSNIVLNIFVLWFLVLVAPIICFYFVKKFVSSSLTAFIFSLLLLFNSYILTNIVVGHLLLSVAFYIGLASFTQYANFIESRFKNILSLLLASILVWITGIVDFRIFYLLMLCFAAYQIMYLLLHKIKIPILTFISRNFLFLLLALLLNFNWIFPTLFITGTNDILARPIFGKGLIDLFNSWSGTYYYWSISNKIEWGVDTGFPIIFMLLPVAAMIALYHSKKEPTFLIFVFLFLMGSFFGKQNTAPFSRIYEFLFTSFPGFSAFRDATKFFQITLLTAPIVLAIGYEKTKHIIARNVIVGITLLIVGLNIYSLVRFQNHLFIEAPVADYYQDVFELEDGEFHRVLWIPRHETIRTGSVMNPRLSFLEMKDTTWVPILRKAGASTLANDILRNYDLPALLSMSSVKYLVVPPQLQTENMFINDDAFYYEDNREEMINILNSFDWLSQKAIKSQVATIYINQNSRPHIYLTDQLENFDNTFNIQAIEVNYDYHSPSRYTLYLNNISNKMYLTFTDTYSDQWLLGPAFNSTWDFINWKDMPRLIEIKFKNEAQGNVFVIDKQLITNMTDDYVTNSDGSINAKISLYFSPQKQLVWGNIVTLTALFAVMLFIISVVVKRIVLKRKNEQTTE